MKTRFSIGFRAAASCGVLLVCLQAAAFAELSDADFARKSAGMERRADRLVEHAASLRKAGKTATQGAFEIIVERPFVVAGDLSRAELQRWAQGTIRWAVAKMKRQYFKTDPDAVLEIWLFDGKESYERNVKQLFGRKPSTPYGYYSPRNGALVMNIRTGGGTLVHEILHPFMEANFEECPSWFNEGLASLYEQSREHEGKIWGQTNWRLAGLKRAIQAKGVPTFRDLLSTTPAEFYADRTGVHYAQARYLCYYLQEHGKLDAFYHSFHANHEKDPTGYNTLVRLLGERDMAAFQSRWEAYVMKLKF